LLDEEKSLEKPYAEFVEIEIRRKAQRYGNLAHPFIAQTSHTISFNNWRLTAN
jgi:hypothetical protein